MTVTLPDGLAEPVNRAAGGDGQLRAYVAAALADYQERSGLDEILAGWRDETPVPEEIRRQAGLKLDQVGTTGSPGDQHAAGPSVLETGYLWSFQVPRW